MNNVAIIIISASEKFGSPDLVLSLWFQKISLRKRYLTEISKTSRTLLAEGLVMVMTVPQVKGEHLLRPHGDQKGPASSEEKEEGQCGWSLRSEQRKRSRFSHSLCKEGEHASSMLF